MGVARRSGAVTRTDMLLEKILAELQKLNGRLDAEANDSDESDGDEVIAVSEPVEQPKTRKAPAKKAASKKSDDS